MDRHSIVLNKKIEGYDHLNLESPSKVVPGKDKMIIFKPNPIGVYDNLYSKPAQAGVPTNSRFSTAVLFSVNGIIYYGQYDFTMGMWGTLPGGEGHRTFKDRVVQYWFYPPGTLEMFRKYAADVEAGRCQDNISRMHEYVEGKEEIYIDAREEWN